MSHDYTIRLQVVADEYSEDGNYFRFLTTDGNGKIAVSPIYRTADVDRMYDLERFVDSEAYRTRTECADIRAAVRKHLAAVTCPDYGMTFSGHL